MEKILRVSQWKEMLNPVLETKVHDFKLMGYSRTTSEVVWNCLVKKVWKGDPEKRLFEVVEDIFHLSSNIYMSYLTVQAYQNDDLAASIAALTGPNE
ncbi:post-transcriptional regulator [Aquibacillus saliphilus]|uniref:post-transcriptional regulator n=1 Tax=Aquibacillus saliphilus TaxID=1909422 RepID=UPI001CF02923|nr:post-transcriptional regulator [Aquibacillus saliphilus]